MTGVLIAPDGTLAGKKLELLREVLPRASRIALLVPDDPGVTSQVGEIRKAASALGLPLVVVEVRNDVERIFEGVGLPVERPTSSSW